MSRGEKPHGRPNSRRSATGAPNWRRLARSRSSVNISFIPGAANTSWSPAGEKWAKRSNAVPASGRRAHTASHRARLSGCCSVSSTEPKRAVSCTTPPGGASGPRVGNTLPMTTAATVRDSSWWAHASTYGPPPESPTMPKRSMPSWSTHSSTSAAQSTMAS